MKFRRAGDSILYVVILSLAFFLFLQPRRAAAQHSNTNAVAFFTNASARFLQTEFGLTVNQIQIYPTNQYTPAVHRLFQVAANLWESTADSTNGLPTVFRPRFVVTNGAVFLSSHVLVTNKSELDALPLLDLTVTNAATLIPPSGDALVFGVPLVLGARKGLPNFNEFAAEVLFSISRKLQVRKVGNVIVQTNQAFFMELTMPVGVEFWNSYATNYGQPVSIFVTNYTTIIMTNDLGVRLSKVLVMGDQLLATNDWRGYKAFTTRDPKSFIVLLRTNLPALPAIAYLPNHGSNGFFSTNVNIWDDSQQLLLPRWGIAISNRLCATIVAETGNEVIDQVVLGGMNYVTNLTDILADSWFYDSATPASFQYLWVTNQAGDFLSGRIGVIQQLNISIGAVPLQGNWMHYGKFQPANPQAAIAAFNQFVFTVTTNGYATAPFTPTAIFRIPLTWQVNDPFVNDFSEQLYDHATSGNVMRIALGTGLGTSVPGIGYKNSRYSPWPIDPGSTIPDAFNATLKDPLVRASDDWNFPNGQPLDLEYLGRVHRGTPWQSLYLKSSDMGRMPGTYSLAEWLVNLNDDSPAIRWRSWTGNNDLTSGYYTRPVRDRALLGIIAAALVESDPRQKLSVNTTDSGIWRGVFDGLTVLTNSLSLALTNDVLVLDSNSPQVQILVDGIASARVQQPRQVFQRLGDVFATPELSDTSPWLDRSTTTLLTRTITDEMYEKIPAQLLSLVREDSEGSVVSVGTNRSVRFTGLDNYPYAVQVSTNFLTWTTVSTNYPTNGVFEYAPTSSMTSREFYRSVLLP